VEVQDVNLKSTRIAPGDGYTFFCEKGNCAYHLEAFFGSKREEVTGDWRILHSCMVFILTKYYSDEQN